MYTIYVLKSEVALKSYVGVTDNLERRIAEHNSGKNFYTKRHRILRGGLMVVTPGFGPGNEGSIPSPAANL